MKIDREEARRIAALARIEFDDAALDRMAAEMSKILTYIDQLAAMDDGTAGADDGVDAAPFREDVPQASLAREDVERNAPAWSDGFFVVPKVIGGD